MRNVVEGAAAHPMHPSLPPRVLRKLCYYVKARAQLRPLMSRPHR
jgi:hypothetical protein